MHLRLNSHRCVLEGRLVHRELFDGQIAYDLVAADDDGVYRRAKLGQRGGFGIRRNAVGKQQHARQWLLVEAASQLPQRAMDCRGVSVKPQLIEAADLPQVRVKGITAQLEKLTRGFLPAIIRLAQQLAQ